MRFLAFLVASLVLVSVPARAQSCYSQSLQSGALQTVYPQTQTFSTVHTINVPTQVTVQHTVQSVVQQPVIQQQVFSAPAVSQCSQQQVQSYAVPFSAPLAVSSCGATSLGVPFATNYQSYGNSFNSGFRTVNHAAFSNNFGAFGSAVGGSGVSITAQDRRGTAVQANGINNVRIQRDFLGRIKGATADTSRRGLAGLLPF
jgi:hypothetical protein